MGSVVVRPAAIVLAIFFGKQEVIVRWWRGREGPPRASRLLKEPLLCGYGSLYKMVISRLNASHFI